MNNLTERLGYNRVACGKKVIPLRQSAFCREKINKDQKVAYFRAFCEVSIIRGALRKARFSYVETYLLFSLAGEK